MRASLVYRNKRVFPDGSIEEIVIWRIPKATSERPHQLKYRLYFGQADGTCLVRYDNESGKGDHKHLLGNEEQYVFFGIDELIQDFFADVKRAREGTL